MSMSTETGPRFAPNRDPLKVSRVTVALAPAELVRVAQPGRARRRKARMV